jgi:hypothetical protein
MHHASSTWHLSGALVGLQVVHRMLGEHIVFDRGLQSLALLGMLLVNSSEGVFAITSLGALIVIL